MTQEMSASTVWDLPSADAGTTASPLSLTTDAKLEAAPRYTSGLPLLNYFGSSGCTCLFLRSCLSS